MTKKNKSDDRSKVPAIFEAVGLQFCSTARLDRTNPLRNQVHGGDFHSQRFSPSTCYMLLTLDANGTVRQDTAGSFPEVLIDLTCGNWSRKSRNKPRLRLPAHTEEKTHDGGVQGSKLRCESCYKIANY